MWPSKNRVGPQLTYGINGPPVIVQGPTSVSIPEKPTLQYPRRSEEVSTYHRIENSLVEFSPGIGDLAPKLRHRKAAPSANLNEEFAVSSDLLKAATAEARSLHEHTAYDPSKGPLSLTFTLGTGGYSTAIKLQKKFFYPRAKTSIMAIQCHAFTPDRNTLRLVPMMPRSRNYFDQRDPQNSHKHVFNNPDLSLRLAECSFPFEIHQIDVCHDRKVLVVRGLAQVVFLSVRWQNRPGAKGILLTKLFSVEWGLANLVQVAITPGKFVLLDCERNYTVYDYSLKEQWNYTEVSSGKLPENAVLDHSAWKRLCWAPKGESFLYFTRKGITRVNVKTSKAQKLVTFHMWSRALDFALFGENLLLLTSQELIWTRVAPDGALTRLLSWKHHLDNSDVSLKLSACHSDGIGAYLCLLYSDKAPASLMFSFGTRDGLPCSIRDPYLFHTHTKYPRFVSLFESPLTVNGPGSILNVVEMSESYRSVFSRYTVFQDRAFRSPKVPFVDPSPSLEPTFSQLKVTDLKQLYQVFSSTASDILDTLSESQPLEEQTSKAKNFFDASDTSGEEGETSLKKAEVSIEKPDKKAKSREDSPKSLAKKSPIENKDPPQLDQRGIVQEYAFKLGTDIRAVFDNDFTSGSHGLTNQFPYHSLASIAETVPLNVTDLPEFESMLAQLRKHYESQNVTLNALDFQVLEHIDPSFAQAKGSIANIPDVLRKFSQNGRSGTAIFLITSLIRAHQEFRNDYLDAISREVQTFPKELSSIVDDWEIADSRVTSGGSGLKSSSKTSPTRPPPRAKAAKKKTPLLQKALTQNSQHYADSQDFSESDEVATPFASQNSESQLPETPSDLGFFGPQNGSAAYSNIPSSPPLVSMDPDFSLTAHSQSPTQSPTKKPRKESKIQQQSQSQLKSQGASQPSSQQKSQSVKRPGSQPLARKKKKTKGGFA